MITMKSQLAQHCGQDNTQDDTKKKHNVERATINPLLDKTKAAMLTTILCHCHTKIINIMQTATVPSDKLVFELAT